MARNDTDQKLSILTVVALTLGIASVLLFLTVARMYAPFALTLGASAIVVGLIGGNETVRRHESGVWLARVGVALGLLTVLLSVWAYLGW